MYLFIQLNQEPHFTENPTYNPNIGIVDVHFKHKL